MATSSQFDSHKLTDFTVCDPIGLDTEFPYEQFVTHFISEGSVVHATVWIAEGGAAKGTAILSPQIFGGDRLESLIIPLMTSGINVMTFHPRGMWDNQHVYSLTSALDDVLAAAALIRSTAAADGPKTPQGRSWRTDPTRIAVMGLSGGGGNVALIACAEDAQINAAIAIAPNSMTSIGSSDGSNPAAAGFEIVKKNTAGRIDMMAILDAMTPADLERLSPITQARRLVDKNVLLIGALRDTVSPIEPNHKVIAKTMRDVGARGFSDVILETDHAFLSKRIALARVVIAWLRQQCDF